ncbi:MAG: sigma-54-dependent Fis family transcriptional regulator, partial [Planctomycetota bacterium]|nr:sigma-54-dependent Fis family transcriptional regulator [Planctomycetota bacterium]
LRERARCSDDPQREAALLVNLATVHRRLGRPARALEDNTAAVAAYRRAGHLPGLALARTQLGGLLRDAGELARAEVELAAAAELRGRLGDAGGRALVRGTLGLVRARRGHPASALEDLVRAAAELDGDLQSAHGPLLAATIAEQRALLGRGELEAEDPGALGSAEPRVQLARGRAAIVGGALERASRLLRGAAEAARARGDRATAAEASFLLANGLRPPRVAARAEGEDAAPLVAEDRRLLELLLLPDGELDGEAGCELAEDLERRGRDDRACRLWLRLAAAGAAPLERAKRSRERCGAGAAPAELASLSRHLLGFPDPRPDDLELFDQPETLDPDDMDLLRLLELNHRLVRQEDQQSLLGTIVEEALAVTGAERGFLILEEDGILRLDVARDSSRGGLNDTDFEVSGSVIQRSLEQQRCLRISDASDDPLLGGAASVQALELRSVLCAPFPIDASLRGVIYLDNRLVRGAFDERAERLLGLLADQASLAIAQVRRREEIEQLNAELEQRIEVRETELEQARRNLSEAGLARPVGGLIGRGSAMEHAKRLIERVAPTELSVLVVGPSGSGKELAARALHDLSDRAAAAFVSENCAAMPAALAEAELFGVRRGAFTGAERDRPGLFERAEGGTLFLDEIGEMPMGLQAKLLRALETRAVRPVGGEELIPVDFRLVAATNRDLEVEVEAGTFRRDLLYRIRAIEIAMPPLAQCREDLPELVRHFLQLEAARSGSPKDITPAVLAQLVARDWPGNVRELRNEVQRLFALSGDVIDSPELIRPAARAGGAGLNRTLEELERTAILAALEQHGGDKRRAAAALGISRAKIYQRLKEWREEDGEA